MMKSFFKKLSLVMALAMVVSMMAPAGSAFAAEAGIALQGTKEVVTEYSVEIGAEVVDFCFLGAPADWKTTAKWSSDNEEVATVDKAGKVTGLKDGVANIIITAGADASYKHSVKVTVGKGDVKPLDFEITQIDTVTAKLTFNEVADLSKVTVDDFAVTAIDEMFEYTLFANTVAVKENVVTLTFVEGVLTDGAVIKVGFQGVEKTLVASNGEVARVDVAYGMTDKYEGDAYVYTELDPDYVLLSYKLYDAKGIDVTANYEENVDYTIEWTLKNAGDHASEPEEDAEDGWQMSFDAKGAATVIATVTFTNEDGEERPIESLPTTIVAQNRPAISFTFDRAGISNIAMRKENVVNAVKSFSDPNGTVWTDAAYKNEMGATIQKGKSSWFAARLTDNRGKAVISTQLACEYNEKTKKVEVSGSTEYKDYGYFVYESSNEDILAVDDDGYVTGVNVGSATILVSFVKYNEEGEELAPVKVGSKKITVTTDYPEPYLKTFEFVKDSLTVTSTGDALYAPITDTAYVKFYDQYGRVMTSFTADELNAATIITVSSTYEDAIDFFRFGSLVTTGDYKNSYPVTFSGDDLNDLITIKDNGYSTFKFTLEFDKDIEDFSKVVTKNDKVSVKVYNVDKYYAELTEFYAATASAVKTDFSKWNWTVYNEGANGVDTYVDKRTEFDALDADAILVKEVGVKLTSSAGLTLMHLPESHFIKLTEKVDTINKMKEEERAFLVEGAIYYQINYPSKYKNAVAIDTDRVTFIFNDLGYDVVVDDEVYNELLPATEGTYSVSLYYVNSKNKLVKLGSNVASINVTNSTPAVKAEGFKKTNVSENALYNEADVIRALEEMYNFSWNGELLYDEDREVAESASFSIYDIPDKKLTISDDKVVIEEITFIMGYFNNCEPDGEGSVDNNTDKLYQTYTLKKRITIKID